MARTTTTADTAGTDTTTTADTAGTIEAFVLCDCCFGKCGEVVLLTEAEVANGLETGTVDTSSAAVENAKAQ